MFYFYIYKVSLQETGEFYIGSRKSTLPPNEDINYKGSMVTWKVDKSKLHKEILEIGFNDIESLREAESSIIKDCIKDPLNKNSHIPNKGFYNKGHTEETKEKMRKKIVSEKTKDILRKRIISKDTIEKLKAAWKNRPPVSEESKKKMSDSKLNMSDATKKKMSDSRLGVSRSDETKKKISASRLKFTDEEKKIAYHSNKGMSYNMSEKPRKKKGPLSEEHKQNISKAKKGIPGKKHTEETKEKMRKPKNKNI